MSNPVSRRRRVPAVLIAGVFVAFVMVIGDRSLSQTPGREALSPTRATLVALLAGANALDLAHAEQGTVPGPTDGLVALRSLRGSVAFGDERHFPVTDAWGRDVLYWSNGANYVLFSFGADGKPDAEYSGHSLNRALPIGVRTTDPDQDIIILDGQVVQGPEFKRFGMSTLDRMRALSVAVKTYAIDNNDFPLPTAGTDIVALLEPHLVPIYIPTLPTEDEWGQPLLYWSDLTNFAIVSTGKDGQAEAPYTAWGTEDFRRLSTTVRPFVNNDLFIVEFCFPRN